MLTFTFVPLSPLARERCRVRSLGLSADRYLSGTTLAGFARSCDVLSVNTSNQSFTIAKCEQEQNTLLLPLSRFARRQWLPSGRGNPRRGFPRQKQSTGLFLLPFLRFFKKSSKNDA